MLLVVVALIVPPIVAPNTCVCVCGFVCVCATLIRALIINGNACGVG